MRRTTVREGVPPEAADDPFGEMFKAAGVSAFSQPAKAPA